MHTISNSSDNVSVKNRLNWKKWGEMFLTQDLVRVYVCSICAAVQEPSKVISVNDDFVTDEAHKLWHHVQQSHSDILQLLVANFQKECLLEEPAKKKLKVQSVIVIDDDEDGEENGLLGDELLLEKQTTNQQDAVSSNEMVDQNPKQPIEAENSGSILMSLLNSTQKKFHVPESSKTVEDILMDYQMAEDEKKFKQFCSIESQLREMHGDTTEIDKNEEKAMQVGGQVSISPSEDELTTKSNFEIFYDNDRTELNNSISESVVDLKKVLEIENNSVSEDTIENYSFNYNDDTKECCEISKTVALLDFAKESTLEENCNNRDNNTSNNNNNNANNSINKSNAENNNNSEINLETIELSDGDEEDIEAEEQNVKKKDVTLEYSSDSSANQINIRIQSLPETNKNFICPFLCGKQFETNQQIMEHLKQHLNEAQQKSEAHSQLMQQMPTLSFQDQQNQSNYCYNQTSPNGGLPAPFYEMFKCTFCEQRFHGNWQKIRHEKIHFRRQHLTSTVNVNEGSKMPNSYSLRPFKCTMCSIRTTTKKSMLKHLHRYHPGIQIHGQTDLQPNYDNANKTFKCLHCCLDYKTKPGLKSHVKRIHPNLVSSELTATPDARTITARDAAAATSPNTVPAPLLHSPLAPPLESNTSNTSNSSNTSNITLLQEQVDMMNYNCRWHMESSYQPAWATNSFHESMESIGTLLPASCEFRY